MMRFKLPNKTIVLVIFKLLYYTILNIIVSSDKDRQNVSLLKLSMFVTTIPF